MQVPVYNLEGEVIEQIELREDVFGLTVNEPLLHQAVVRQLANQRVGTSSSKTRGEVAGSRKKLVRQKGTGHARHGNTTAPIYRGGGITFGPRPRSFEQRMPKKMRRAALRSALSAKVAAQQLLLVDSLDFAEPKTKQMVAVLSTFAVRSTLVVLPDANDNVVKSARNIPNVMTMPVQNLNVLDVLRYQHLLMPVAAVRKVEQALGQSEQAQEE
ncbi:MAG: 50S ribosomal protein L4 [Chloroflexota bacterium]